MDKSDFLGIYIAGGIFLIFGLGLLITFATNKIHPGLAIGIGMVSFGLTMTLLGIAGFYENG